MRPLFSMLLLALIAASGPARAKDCKNDPRWVREHFDIVSKLAKKASREGTPCSSSSTTRQEGVRIYVCEFRLEDDTGLDRQLVYFYRDDRLTGKLVGISTSYRDEEGVKSIAFTPDGDQLLVAFALDRVEQGCLKAKWPEGLSKISPKRCK